MSESRTSASTSPDLLGAPRDVWEKIRIGSNSIALVLIPVVLAIAAHYGSVLLKNRDLNLEMTKLALEVLQTDPQETQQEGIRDWATIVLEQHSGVSLSEKAKENLRTQPLRLQTEIDLPYNSLISKDALVQEVASKTGLGADKSKAAIDALLTSIADALNKGNKVRLDDFGSFAVRMRAARTRRNPQTGEIVRIPALRIPIFKPGKDLRDLVRTGRLQPSSVH